MDTNAQVHALLVDHPDARAAAEVLDAHSLMSRLKELYESLWGRVSLDHLDWHWQAVTLQNVLVGEKVLAESGEPHAAEIQPRTDAPAEPTSDAALPDAEARGPAPEPLG